MASINVSIINKNYLHCIKFLLLIFYLYCIADPSEGLVRVIKRETGERCLIKGLDSLIEDISFAHLYEIIILACIDQSGTVNIYAIKEGPRLFDAILIFQIKGVGIFI